MTDPTKKQKTGNKNQGEGDRESAARYNQATREYVEAGKVEEGVRKARGQDPQEAERSERAGKKHVKEEDPSVHRDYSHGEK